MFSIVHTPHKYSEVDFQVDSEAGGELQEEGDKTTVEMQTIPDGLLVLFVLFTVDYFYPIFSGPRTP